MRLDHARSARMLGALWINSAGFAQAFTGRIIRKAWGVSLKPQDALVDLSRYRQCAHFAVSRWGSDWTA